MWQQRQGGRYFSLIGTGVGSWRGSEFGKAVGQGGKLSLHLGGTTVEGHSEIFRFCAIDTIFFGWPEKNREFAKLKDLYELFNCPPPPPCSVPKRKETNLP